VAGTPTGSSSSRHAASIGAASTLKVGEANYRIFNVSTLEASGVANVGRMPLLEVR
jgi:hypothetical protein